MSRRWATVAALVGLCAWAVAAPSAASRAPKNSIFQPADFASLGTLNVPAGAKISFDTGAAEAAPAVSGVLTGAGTLGVIQGGSVQVAVFSFDAIRIDRGALVEVVGDRALVLLARTTIRIDATIDLSGGRGGAALAPGRGGPGADGGVYGKSTESAPPPPDGGDGGPGMKDNGRPGRGCGAGYNQRVKGATSGGVGAYGGLGGAASEGSSGGGGGTRPMPGGTGYGDARLRELLGGSGGAGGSNDRGGSNAAGGGGGGAIALVATESLTLGPGARLLLRGGAGGVDSVCGGGGSGGGILLASPTIALDAGAVVDARGGDGGDGGPAVLAEIKQGGNRRNTGSGGGGGGGRVACYADNDFGAPGKGREEAVPPPGVSIAGGTGGTAAADGASGTFHDGTWAEAQQDARVRAALRLTDPGASSARLVELATGATDWQLHAEVLYALDLLGEAGDAGVASLAGDVASPARLAALKRLRKAYPGSLDVLAAASQDDAPAISAEALALLANWGGARALRIITAAVTSEKPACRGFALQAAAHCRTIDEPLAAALGTAVAHDTVDAHAVAALKALAVHGVRVKLEAVAIPRLSAMLADPDAVVARAATDALGRLAPADLQSHAATIVPGLVALLGHGTPEVAYAAVDAVSRMGQPAVQPLMVAVRSSGMNQGRRAVVALGQLGPAAEAAIPLLKEMAVTQKDALWQRAIADALARIQGK
jgi:HEAT repeat protein